MAAHGAALRIGNYIKEEAKYGYVRRSKSIRRRGRFIPLPQNGVSSPDKYVLTDAEAVEANASISEPKRRKISLESKKCELNAGRQRIYGVEMMLAPVAAGRPYATVRISTRCWRGHQSARSRPITRRARLGNEPCRTSSSITSAVEDGQLIIARDAQLHAL